MPPRSACTRVAGTLFISTFAAFFSRAYDFVRMAAISRVDLRLAGSHAGVSIGEDGPSQMALEDVASLRAIHSSVVLHPCDANQTAKLVVAMADTKGIVFLRTLRPNTPVIYGPDEEFEVGGSKVIRSSEDDAVTIVGMGITVHEALKAADSLEDDGIKARVIDAYSIKPIDADTLQAAAEATGKIVTVEDHFPEGGLGDAVLAALAEQDEHPRVVKLAVREMPRSGKPDELLSAYGIDAEHIEAAVRQLVGSEVTTTRRRAAAAVRGRHETRRPCPAGARRLRRAARAQASRPSRSSTTTAAPRSDASGTADVVIGRPSASAMICTQSGSFSSAAPVATTSSMPGSRSAISANRNATPSSPAWRRSSGVVSKVSPCTAPFAC